MTAHASQTPLNHKEASPFYNTRISNYNNQLMLFSRKDSKQGWSTKFLIGTNCYIKRLTLFTSAIMSFFIAALFSWNRNTFENYCSSSISAFSCIWLQRFGFRQIFSTLYCFCFRFILSTEKLLLFSWLVFFVLFLVLFFYISPYCKMRLTNFSFVYYCVDCSVCYYSDNFSNFGYLKWFTNL